jgi:hypothetical protein
MKRMKRRKPRKRRRLVRHLPDKMIKTRILTRRRALKRYIPETLRMDRTSLNNMLEKWGMVYVKPVRGAMGRGVMRVERIERRHGSAKKRFEYRIQIGEQKRRFGDYISAYRAIRHAAGGEPYLAQRGIRLLSYRGRIFDIRVMVQRNPRGRWEVTGIAGRAAHPRKAVTNGSQGGTIYPVSDLLRANMGTQKRRSLTAAVRRIGLQAARQMGRAYPGIQEIGADIALDRQRRPWILEVNTRPDPCPFTKLPDRRMLRRILYYGSMYGRRYKLDCTKSKPGRV